MTAHSITTSDPTIAELRAIIAAQQSHIRELSRSHLGILSGPAIRRELRLLETPCDLIALDFRKLHEWNDILGYDLANRFFGDLCRTREHTRRRSELRMQDVRGQWGGDEIVIACAVGSGRGLLLRLVRALDDLSAQLSTNQRQAIVTATGGLIDGFAAVFVLIESSRCPLVDAARAVAECGELKRGIQTGDRATSGRPGTIIGTLATSGGA